MERGEGGREVGKGRLSDGKRARHVFCLGEVQQASDVRMREGFQMQEEPLTCGFGHFFLGRQTQGLNTRQHSSNLEPTQKRRG